MTKETMVSDVKNGLDSPLRLLLIEGEPAHREFARLALRDVPWLQVVAEAGDLEAACREGCAGTADVALVDLLSPFSAPAGGEAPGLHGLQLAQTLHRVAPQLHLVLTSDEDSASLHQLARACGALGLAPRRHLAAATTRLLAGLNAA